MLLLDCTNDAIYISFVAFYAVMSTIGCIRKKAWFNLTSVIVNIALFVLHALSRDRFNEANFRFNMNFDMVCLAVNIPILILVDEIETRRNIIKEVFKNRYKEE